MWMLVRDRSSGAAPGSEQGGPRTLAASPDSDDRGEPWRWSVALVPDGQGWTVRVETDPEHVRATSEAWADGAVVDVARPCGDQLVVVPTLGQCLVAASVGPWRRWLGPGDVFVGEGEDDEDLRVSLAPGPGAVTLVHLSPTTAQPLRWVP